MAVADRVAVVTDSTACLPTELAAATGVHVVPLTVVVDGVPGVEGEDVSPADVAKALAARREVTTSRPAPEYFAEVYRRLLAAGSAGVVSVHLSARLSGTCESARLAAARTPGRVAVVDSRSIGMGLGFAALAAAQAAAQATGQAAAQATGQAAAQATAQAAAAEDLSGVRDAAVAAAGRTTTLFYVDSLEHLRRGGRVGAAQALLGTALSVKPILHVSGGEIVVGEKVRTASRALARLVDLAVEAAGDASTVDVAVHHLDAPERAALLAEQIAARLGERLAGCHLTEIGAAAGAHAGPGLASVVVYRRG